MYLVGCLLGVPLLLMVLFPFGLFVAGLVQGDGGQILAGGIGVVFAAPFLGIAVALVLAQKKKRPDPRLREMYPDQPWMWNAEWAAGRIRWRATMPVITWVLYAPFIAGGLICAALIPTMASRVAWPFVFLLLMGPLLSILLLGSAVRAAMQARKYGGGEFEIVTVPGVIGGQLVGLIHLGPNVQPEEDFELVLKCIRSTTVVSEDEKGRTSISTEQESVWEATEVISHKLCIQHHPPIVPVVFAIPGDCPATGEQSERSSVSWQLFARAATRGVDYEARFEVPVFATGDRSFDFASAAEVLRQYRVEPTREQRARAARVRIDPMADGTIVFVFPPPRSLVHGIMFVLMGVAVGGIVYLVAQDSVFFGMLFAGPFLLFFFVGILQSCFCSVRTTVGPQRLSIQRSYLGLGRTRVILGSQVEEFDVVNAFPGGHHVVARLRHHHTRAVSGIVFTADQAKWIGEEFAAILNQNGSSA